MTTAIDVKHHSNHEELRCLSRMVAPATIRIVGKVKDGGKRAKEFGERLREAMLTRGYTLDRGTKDKPGVNALDEKAGMASGQASRYVRGQRMSVDEAIGWAYAHALDVNYLWLMGRGVDMNAPNRATREETEMEDAVALGTLGLTAKREGVFGPEIVDRVRRRAEREGVATSDRPEMYWRAELYKEAKRAIIAFEHEAEELLAPEPRTPKKLAG